MNDLPAAREPGREEAPKEPEPGPAEEPEVEAEAEPVLPEPVEAVLRQIPEAERPRVRSSFAALMQFQGQLPNPFINKLTPTHLDKLIDGAEKDNQRMYVDRREDRTQVKFLTVAGIVGFLAVAALFLLMQQTDLLEKVIQIVVLFAGGIGAGYGLSRRGE